MKVNVIRFSANATLPAFKTDGAAGFDLSSTHDEFWLKPKCSAIVSTGIGIEVPKGFVMLIRGRSGIGFNDDVIAFDGTIDSDYQGEIKVKLFNLGFRDFHVCTGDRIAQGILVPCESRLLTSFDWADAFGAESGRGTGGFGSTGRSA